MSRLIAELCSPDPIGRSKAAEALSRLAPEARQAAVPLVRTCGDELEEVAAWAVAALEEVGRPFPEDIPRLASLLTHESADVGYWAATLLGRLGREAALAVPTLAETVIGPQNRVVRERAAWALGQIERQYRGHFSARGESPLDNAPYTREHSIAPK